MGQWLWNQLVFCECGDYALTSTERAHIDPDAPRRKAIEKAFNSHPITHLTEHLARGTEPCTLTTKSLHHIFGLLSTLLARDTLLNDDTLSIGQQEKAAISSQREGARKELTKELNNILRDNRLANLLTAGLKDATSPRVGRQDYSEESLGIHHLAPEERRMLLRIPNPWNRIGRLRDECLLGQLLPYLKLPDTKKADIQRVLGNIIAREVVFHAAGGPLPGPGGSPFTVDEYHRHFRKRTEELLATQFSPTAADMLLNATLSELKGRFCESTAFIAV